MQDLIWLLGCSHGVTVHMVPPQGVFTLFLRKNPEAAMQEFEEFLCIMLL